VSSVSASDPYATREPFTVDYEISMPKFVDWSKKPVRIPALLPQLGLPIPPRNQPQELWRHRSNSVRPWKSRRT